MPPIRDILVHVDSEVALKRRKCHRSAKHSIRAGELCLVVKETPGRKNYCRDCATQVLDQADARLRNLRQMFNDEAAPILSNPTTR